MGKNYLDVLSDEALSRIIYFVVADDRAFWLDQAFLPRRRLFKGKENEKRAPGYLSYFLTSLAVLLPRPFSQSSWQRQPSPTEIYYRHSGLRVRYGTHLPAAQQPQHIADWLFVNSTSSRVRRLGKPVLFAAKPLAATSALVDQLRTGTGTSIMMSPKDQSLALSEVRELVLVDFNSQRPTALVKLHSRVRSFTQLQRCHLLFDFPVPVTYVDPDYRVDLSPEHLDQCPVTQIWKAKPRTGEEEYTVFKGMEAVTHSTKGTPELLHRFRDLLVRGGFPVHVRIDVSEYNNWLMVARDIKDTLCPFLEAWVARIENIGAGAGAAGDGIEE